MKITDFDDNTVDTIYADTQERIEEALRDNDIRLKIHAMFA